MKRTGTVSLIALSLVLAAGIVGTEAIVAPSVAIAAQKTLSPKVGAPLQAAQALAKKNQIKEAVAKAQEAEKVSNKTPYETYMVNFILAIFYSQLNDYPNAQKALEASLASGEMPPAEAITVNKQLASLNYASKNYPKTIEFGNRYLKDNPGDAEVMILVGQSHYLQGNFKQASETVRASIKAAQAASKAPKEEWLQLLMSSEYKQDNTAGVLSSLEQLVAIYPKDAYWKDIFTLYEKNLRGGANKTTLDIYFVKFHLGALAAPQEYSEMTELALQDGLPGIAKKVMDKGMAAGVLGQSAQKERETRLLTMATTQADADLKTLAKGEAEAMTQKTGDALVKFGEAYWSYGQYDKAVEVIHAGIAKGVQNGDDAKLRLGIAYIGAGKRAQALEAFKGIAAGSVSSQIAKLWTLAANAPKKA